MNYKKLWEEAVKILKKTLPEHAYEAWIETLSPVGITNDIFILEAPNQFAYDWIINNYQDIILSSIKEKNKNLQIKISIAPQSEQSISATSLEQHEPTKQSNPGRRNNINPNNIFNTFIIN